MEFIREIVVVAAEVLTLLCSLTGIALSGMLLVNPEGIRALNDRFALKIDLDHRLRILDEDIQTSRFVYRHHFASGSLLLLGSLVVLAFLHFRLDAERFSMVFFGSNMMSPLQEIFFQTAVLFGKFCSFIGVGLGVLLLFAAESLESVETKLTTRISTERYVDFLNAYHGTIDRIFLQHPKTFGAAGLFASAMLTYVTSTYLIHRP